MLESRIEGKTVAYAEKCGVLHLKLNVRGRKGWPDHIFIKNKKLMFIEFKAPDEKPTILQKHIHSLLRKQGMEVQVHDHIGEACEAIRHFLLV